MQQDRPWRPLAVSAKAVFGAVLSLLLLLSSLAAASPGHEQAHLAQHAGGGLDCVLCLLAHGLVDLADATPVLVQRDLVLTDGFAPVAFVFVSAPDYQLLPGRAPPSFS